MSQSQHSSSRSTSSRGGYSTSEGDPSRSRSSEWSEIQDPSERRKVQNKLAQRRFRDKARDQKEEAERHVDNQRRAASSYTSPEPSDIDHRRELSGLPWGGISMKHIVEAGKTKEQNSQRSSRESSVYAAASRTGGSSSASISPINLREAIRRGDIFLTDSLGGGGDDLRALDLRQNHKAR